MFVRADVSYSGKLCGLCGNFNGISSNEDEYQLRNGAVVESAQAFAEGWQDEACANPTVTDRCDEQSIERRTPWAEEQCMYITSDLFEQCHPLVGTHSIQGYERFCIRLFRFTMFTATFY